MILDVDPGPLVALSDQRLYGSAFQGSTWNAWRVFLAAVFGLAMTADQLEVYRKHTGREAAPTAQAREAWMIVGRRGGKSLSTAGIAAYLATFRRPAHVAPGEVPTVLCVAADRSQAGTILRYVRGIIEGSPKLSGLITADTKESITLVNGCSIEVGTSSYRLARSKTLIAAVCDEVAFWRTEEDGSNSDKEVLRALRPGLASTKGPVIALSSPYARSGELHRAYREHFGRESDPILVWNADSLSMNPSLDPQVIEDAYRDDPVAAASEYGSGGSVSFRSDVAGFVEREVVEAAVIPQGVVPPVAGIKYFAFLDFAGGSSKDSAAAAVAHADGERVVLDLAHEIRSPFSPERACEELANIVLPYASEVTLDRFAGDFPREQLRKHGLTTKVSEKTKTELYGAVLPLLNSSRVELLQVPTLIEQLVGLERRTSRNGRENIAERPGSRDDVANAAAGALVLASSFVSKRSRKVFAPLGVDPEEVGPLTRVSVAGVYGRMVL